MSVIGVSPSDFVLAAKAINHICSIYKNGPQKLNTVLDSLGELKLQAESLQSIVEVANIQNCPKYGGFDKLGKDLEDASLFLAKFQGLSTPRGALRKVKDATMLSLKESDLTEWKFTLAEHRSRMESYKTLLILNALYNNHRAGAQSKPPADFDDDDDRILRRAVRIMQHRRQSVTTVPNVDVSPTSPTTFRSTAPTLVMGSPEANKVYGDIVSRAEELQLHYRDKAPTQDPAGWAEILDRLAALVPDAGPSTISTGSLLLPLTASPEAFNRGRNETRNTNGMGPLSHIHIPSPTIPELEGSVPLPTPPGLPIIQNTLIPDSPLFSDAPIVDEPQSRSTGGQALVFNSKVYIQCDAMAKSADQNWSEVELQVSQVGNKTYIWVFSPNPAPPIPASRPLPRALTPADILSDRTQQPSPPDPQPLLILKHVIFSHPDSYPVVHHPAVEKGLYDIQFNNQQLIEIEGMSGSVERLSRCVYRFENKTDRDELRSKIFGKRLLASAGYTSVTPAGVCDFQALTLWEDTRSGPGGKTNTYITLPCNGTGTQTGPDRAMLFVVTGCKNLDAVKKKNKPLTLGIATPLDPNYDSLNPTRRTSIVSSSTESSNKSTRRKSLRTDNFKIKKSTTCEILLYDQDPLYKEDKRKLLSILKDRFGAG